MTMAQPRIEMLVRSDGSVTVTTKGFTGSACQRSSRFLLAALGAIQSERLTPEFHQPAPQSHSVRLDNSSPAS